MESKAFAFGPLSAFPLFFHANPASKPTIFASCCFPKGGFASPPAAHPCSLLLLPQQGPDPWLKPKGSVLAVRVVVANAGKDKKGHVQPSAEGSFFASADFWLQAAVVVFTLGFIDAGYSGDWSRVGIISSETEAGLRDGALGVVPLSLLLIWAVYKRRSSNQ